MKKFLMLITISILVSACGHVITVGYSNPSATQQNYLKDRYACIKDSGYVHNYDNVFGDLRSEKGTDCVQFSQCMESKGYIVKLNGEFIPSQKTECDPYDQFVYD